MFLVPDLTIYVQFLPIQATFSESKLATTYMNQIQKLHAFSKTTVSIIASSQIQIGSYYGLL